MKDPYELKECALQNTILKGEEVENREELKKL